jgi:hypothetical protein
MKWWIDQCMVRWMAGFILMDGYMDDRYVHEWTIYLSFFCGWMVD